MAKRGNNQNCNHLGNILLISEGAFFSSKRNVIFIKIHTHFVFSVPRITSLHLAQRFHGGPMKKTKPIFNFLG